MSITIGRRSGRPGNGSVGTSMRRRGDTGRSMPAMRATCAAHGPAAFTTVREAILPRFARTHATPRRGIKGAVAYADEGKDHGDFNSDG